MKKTLALFAIVLGLVFASVASAAVSPNPHNFVPVKPTVVTHHVHSMPHNFAKPQQL